MPLFSPVQSEKSEILCWFVRAATESSKWQELDLESFIFCPIIYNVPHTWLQGQQKDDAHGNESATTQLESESASALCSKSQPAPVLNFNSVSRRIGRAYSSWKRVWKSDILTLMKEAVVLICDSTAGVKFWNSTRCSDDAKLLFSLQLVKFIPNFIPAHAIT